MLRGKQERAWRDAMQLEFRLNAIRLNAKRSNWRFSVRWPSSRKESIFACGAAAFSKASPRFCPGAWICIKRFHEFGEGGLAVGDDFACMRHLLDCVWRFLRLCMCVRAHFSWFRLRAVCLRVCFFEFVSSWDLIAWKFTHKNHR